MTSRHRICTAAGPLAVVPPLPPPVVVVAPFVLFLLLLCSWLVLVLVRQLRRGRSGNRVGRGLNPVRAYLLRVAFVVAPALALPVIVTAALPLAVIIAPALPLAVAVAALLPVVLCLLGVKWRRLVARLGDWMGDRAQALQHAITKTRRRTLW